VDESITFHELQRRLLEHLRQRLRTGEVTERGLSRIAGISQPHLHNVLKGRRLLSMEMSDGILRNLQLDILDLLERRELEARLDTLRGPADEIN
jgi:transcriptional regulator with XRE-family HTH domain